MHFFPDMSQTQCAEIPGPDGEPVECVVIPVAVPVVEIADILAEYDASNQYSPPASDSRALARMLLDALAEARR